MKSDIAKHRGRALPTRLHKKYEDLYSRKNNDRKDEKDSDGRVENNCDHADDDENIEDDEQDNHTPEFSMKELIISIDSLTKRDIRQTAPES